MQTDETSFGLKLSKFDQKSKATFETGSTTTNAP